MLLIPLQELRIKDNISVMIFYYDAPVILQNIFCKRKAKKELTRKQVLIVILHSFLAAYARKDVTIREKLQEISKKHYSYNVYKPPLIIKSRSLHRWEQRSEGYCNSTFQ